jgi:hypothetical protein
MFSRLRSRDVKVIFTPACRRHARVYKCTKFEINRKIRLRAILIAHFVMTQDASGHSIYPTDVRVKLEVIIVLSCIFMSFLLLLTIVVNMFVLETGKLTGYVKNGITCLVHKLPGLRTLKSREIVF